MSHVCLGGIPANGLGAPPPPIGGVGGLGWVSAAPGLAGRAPLLAVPAREGGHQIKAKKIQILSSRRV